MAGEQREPVVIEVSTPIERTPRVQQVEGLFDLAAERVSGQRWEVCLPLHERPWSVGLIVGPSGCGKSTIARRLWPAAWRDGSELVWRPGFSLLDGFPEAMPAKEVVGLLCSVGFSSPPSWLRPYAVLSTGQQFRVTLARVLAEAGTGLVVFDEFTSVVDRTVAQVGSAALAKTVRERRGQFIAVTCHEDVEPWLNPDWVYRPDTNTFAWRLLRRRPDIVLTLRRVDRRAWELFRPHHYLSGHLSKMAACVLAFWQGRPVCFSAWIHSVSHREPTQREHRTVTLPDFQGVGIGHAVSTRIASLYRSLGKRAVSTTTHPAFTASRQRDGRWVMRRRPALSPPRHARQLPGLRHAGTRLTAGFEYVGNPGPEPIARALLG